MAATAYFQKVRESDSQVCYLYGPEVDELTSELVLDKENQRLADDLGHTGRKAAAKIVQLFRERGSWPEKGSSIS